MNPSRREEIKANFQRAENSLAAARELADSGYSDYTASRAYYAAFYAATALLLTEGFEFTKHSAVIASIHQHFVKTGKLSKEHGKNLNWLFELRGTGDYGVTKHVPPEQAEKSIETAGAFVKAARGLAGIVE